MWPFNRKPKHKHQGKVVAVAPYDSITGPRTVISYICECGDIWSRNVKGDFPLEAFKRNENGS